MTSAHSHESRSAGRDGTRLGGRLILVLLTLYAVAMIAPDFLRTVRPLGSLGLTSNADRLVFDVQGPFETQAESPAWRAGLRAGDRVDLSGCAAPSSATSSALRRSRSGAA